MAQIILTNPVPGSAAALISLQPATIESGVTVQVGTNIAAQGATPTPQTPAFAIQPAPGGADRTLNLSAQGIGALPTTVTVTLLASTDGGATWQIYLSNIALFAAGVATEIQPLHMVSGPLFAFVITTLVLGGATGVNLIASLS
jgi:hypothetical protein